VFQNLRFAFLSELSHKKLGWHVRIPCHIRKWCHGSTVAAMLTVMLDDPGSNPGVNHGCMYLSHRTNERTNVFSIK
jgi:hypothetical protein